jgi:hypothetical protein
MAHYTVVGDAAAEEWRRADERLAGLARIKPGSDVR